jgi:Tn3 transposase DDE domain
MVGETHIPCERPFVTGERRSRIETSCLTCLLPNDLARALVFPEPEKHRLTQPIIPSPLRELHLTNHRRLDQLEEPASLIALRQAVSDRLPQVDLPELLLEIDARTGFAGAFTHASEAEARAGELKTSVCAVLVAEACNIGFEPLLKKDVPALPPSGVRG